VLPGHDHPASLARGGGGVQRKTCGARSEQRQVILEAFAAVAI